MIRCQSNSAFKLFVMQCIASCKMQLSIYRITLTNHISRYLKCIFAKFCKNVIILQSKCTFIN
ncbi:hypothetical protein T10_11093, partial [Trichinella papuae]